MYINIYTYIYISTILGFSSLGILAIIILDLGLMVGNYCKQYIIVLLQLHIIPKYLLLSISENDLEAAILVPKL